MAKYLVALLACACLGAVSALEDECNIEQPLVVKIQPTSGKPFKLTLEPSDKILDLKRMISLHEDGRIPVDRQQLSLADSNKPLENELTISSLGIQHETVINLEKSQQKGSYFGVDPDDHEAVRQKLRELNDEKFKEIFGNEVNLDDINFYGHPDDESDNKPKMELLKDAFKWLYNIATGKKVEHQDAPESKEN